MKRRNGCAAAAAGLVLAAGIAEAEVFTERVRFPRGKSSTVLENAVVRGDRDRYLLGAKAGQRMTVRIKSLENNAVFSIERPDGKPIPGTEEGRDVTRWSGKLPKSGDYRIIVGGTRGNATYSLTVSIR